MAIVTGAAMGIGWGITEVLLREGAKVVMVDVDDEAGRDAALAFKQHGRDVEFVHCDVTPEEQIIGAVRAAVDLYGTIDI
ncbi:MAG TPA: SDR family NAD(P)-dependent oxidoreductase, partial [Coriobacteriia bacterium]|nr:SDR family NAD(P)-dependent oxidoreductase [Coriobacteriia bacterium]